jgi:hypothetical protein
MAFSNSRTTEEKLMNIVERKRAGMSALSIVSALALGCLVAAAPAAQAKGCLKGAVGGAVVGHMAGHHAVAGAAGGCALGHHMAHKKMKAKAEQSHS